MVKQRTYSKIFVRKASRDAGGASHTEVSCAVVYMIGLRQSHRLTNRRLRTYVQTDFKRTLKGSLFFYVV